MKELIAGVYKFGVVVRGAYTSCVITVILQYCVFYLHCCILLIVFYIVNCCCNNCCSVTWTKEERKQRITSQ